MSGSEKRFWGGLLDEIYASKRIVIISSLLILAGCSNAQVQKWNEALTAINQGLSQNQQTTNAISAQAAQQTNQLMATPGIYTPSNSGYAPQPVYGSQSCYGTVSNGVCHGTVSPAARASSCHGTVVNGQCMGTIVNDGGN